MYPKINLKDNNDVEYSGPVVVHSRPSRETKAQFLISECIGRQALTEPPSEHGVIHPHLVLEVHILQ